jgi:ATP-dependent Clp protease ATP-binding subunit ClpC
MKLEKLTARARGVLASLPKITRVPVDKVFQEIIDAGGLGNTLAAEYPKISFAGKSVDADKLVTEAFFQASRLEHTYVGTEHLLLSLLKLGKSPDLEAVKLTLAKLELFPGVYKSSLSKRQSPILETFGSNLSTRSIRKSQEGFISRDPYDLLVSSLLLRDSSGVLLVGEKGVGRKSLVGMLAQNSNTLDVPPSLIGCQVISFDLMGFLASVFNKGGFEIGFTAFLEELKPLGKVVLFIKNFENVFMPTSSGLSVPVFYSMFKSGLEGEGIKTVASISSSLYDKIAVDNEHVFEGLTTIDVSEPSKGETLKILSKAAFSLGSYHNINIPEKLIPYIYERVDKEFPEEHFPKKGIDLLDHACVNLLLENDVVPDSYKNLVDESFSRILDIDAHVGSGRYAKAEELRKDLDRLEKTLLKSEKTIFVSPKKVAMTRKDVDRVIDKLLHASVVEERSDLVKLASLSSVVKERVIGQDAAVESVVRGLLRSKMGLRIKKRPLGNFLFLGPTGVGKTELAKVLADEFFGEGGLIRLDMSDFSEKHTVARLVGAPPGYVGYGEGGELTSKIGDNPNCVVLFDEIEKAHPDVLNILLQIMDEAELKDAKGNSFDFSKSVVILTSNLGTEILQNQGIGFDGSRMPDRDVDKRLKGNLKKILKPELLNRFDETLIFKRLAQKEQQRVLEILIKDVIKALRSQKVQLSVTKKVKDSLVSRGYSDEYGARALKRTVETELLDKIAGYLLRHKSRPLKIKADTVGDNIDIIGK